MPDENAKPRHPETNFLPPLDMVLTFFNTVMRKKDQQGKPVEEQHEVEEKNVEKLIERLSEKEK